MLSSIPLHPFCIATWHGEAIFRVISNGKAAAGVVLGVGHRVALQGVGVGTSFGVPMTAVDALIGVGV